jgi:hypothetical protein
MERQRRRTIFTTIADTTMADRDFEFNRHPASKSATASQDAVLAWLFHAGYR